MESELLSKTDNTVRTIEVMISLTGAATRTLYGRDYLPDTLYITYTKLGEWNWKVESVELKGRRLSTDGGPTKLGVSEPLIICEGQVIAEDGPFAVTPALAALVTAHMPKDD